MLCPTCGSPSVSVKNTLDTGPQIRRRRECRTCKHLWWTIEVMEQLKSTDRQAEISELLKRLIHLNRY